MTSLKPARHCLTCEHWEQIETSPIGQCVRNAPIIIDPVTMDGAWPMTLLHNRCAMWAPCDAPRIVNSDEVEQALMNMGVENPPADLINLAYGDDRISRVMKQNGLAFPEAVELLRKKTRGSQP